MVSNQYIHDTLGDLPDFRGCWACDQLSKISFEDGKRHQLVVNTGVSSSSGEHCVYLELTAKGNPVFIDSFGTSIENEHILNFLAKKGYTRYSFSKQRVQSLSSVYCGFYCIHTALCRASNYSMERTLSKFSHTNLELNDAICIKLIEKMS